MTPDSPRRAAEPTPVAGGDHIPTDLIVVEALRWAEQVRAIAAERGELP